MAKLHGPDCDAVKYMLLVLAAGYWTIAIKSDQFKRSSIDACLTNVRLSLFTLKSKTAIHQTQCALICEQHNDCFKFLYCELAGKNCFPIRAMGVVDSESKRSHCTCYVKLNPQCANGGYWKKDRCHCLLGYYGDKCESIVKDCSQAQSQGIGGIREVLVQPQNASNPFPVRCDLKDSGAFTFIQHRKKGKLNFDVDWQAYKRGFGSVKSDFWLGFDQILLLLNDSTLDLEIGLVGTWTSPETFTEKTVLLENFSLAEGTDSYKFQLDLDLHLPTSTLSCTKNGLKNYFAGLNGQPFSTRDRNSSLGSCHSKTTGGWWLDACCPFGNVNARFEDCGMDSNNQSILLIQWPGVKIKETYMKIRT